MSCYSCTKPFSLLRKEKGCPSCGFSYCSKCLDNKIFIKKLNTETKVCAKCKNNEMKLNEPKIFVAPDAYYRRIGAMEESSSIKPNTNSSTDPIDKQITERLAKLREGRNLTSAATTEDDIKKRLQNIKGENSLTTDAELHTRLAKLKGVPLDVVAKPAVLPPPDTRTEQEQADDLIKQYVEQTGIDTKYQDEFDSLISNMESRVLKLKGSNPNPKDSLIIQENNESESEEDSVQHIVEKTDKVKQSDKQMAWSKVTEAFNSNTLRPARTIENLISCYRNIKSKIKKEHSGAKVLLAGDRPHLPDKNEGELSQIEKLLEPQIDGLFTVYDGDEELMTQYQASIPEDPGVEYIEEIFKDCATNSQELTKSDVKECETTNTPKLNRTEILRKKKEPAHCQKDTTSKKKNIQDSLQQLSEAKLKLVEIQKQISEQDYNHNKYMRQIEMKMKSEALEEMRRENKYREKMREKELELIEIKINKAKNS